MKEFYGADINLYDWQKDCLVKWFTNNCRGIINVATGAGKTIFAIAAIKALEEVEEKEEMEQTEEKSQYELLKVKIIVPKIFLAEQWAKALIKILGVKRSSIGIYHGNIKEDERRKYMIYVLNSARYTVSSHIINDYKNNCRVMLICDECHHFGSTENSKVFDFIPHIDADSYYSLGLSATPDLKNPALIKSLGGEIYKYGFDKAVTTGVVADYNAFHISLDFFDDEAEEYDEYTERINLLYPKIIKLKPYLKNYRGDKFYAELQKLAAAELGQVSNFASALLIMLYKRKEIVYLAKSRVLCAEELIKRLPDSKIIVFAERISAVEELYVRLNRANIRVGKYHSEMGSNARNLALVRYADGEINVLLSCRALDEGLNVPDTDTGIIMSSTGSTRQRIQRVGRVLRKSGGKKSKKSIYYLYIGRYFDFVEECEAIPGVGHTGHTEIFELSYNPANSSNPANPTERNFINEEYDMLCKIAINRLIENKTPPNIIDEVKRNFQTGIIRSDWRLSEAGCHQKIEASKNAVEKNYWISISKLAAAKNQLSMIDSSDGGFSE